MTFNCFQRRARQLVGRCLTMGAALFAASAAMTGTPVFAGGLRVLDERGPLPQGLSFAVPVPGRDEARLDCGRPVGEGRLYYYVPRGVDLSKPTGLLIFLHGGGGGSPVSAPENYLATENGMLRPHVDALGFVVAAPSAPKTGTGYRWNTDGEERTMLAVIEDAARRFNLDRSRIVLGGQSMGCYGAYHLGGAVADRLAGAWLSAGAWKEMDFRIFLGTPVYLQQGKWDCAYRFRGDRTDPRGQDWTGPDYALGADELMTRDGVEHVLDLHDGGHALDWEPAQFATRRFVAWAKKLRREPYPRRVAVVTPFSSGLTRATADRRRTRWLEILETKPGEIELDRIEMDGPNHAWTIDELAAQKHHLVRVRRPGARLVAENLGDNRFRVSAENVTAFRILLAKPMGDLSRPFVIDAGALGVRTRAARPVEGEAEFTHELECR